MPPANAQRGAAQGGYSRWTMSETELSVICKNCGSEVSPYVTECPYCGARLRKRAPKLERRGDGLEAQRPRRRRRPRLRRPAPARAAPLPALRDARRDPRLGRPAAGPEGERRPARHLRRPASSRSRASGGASSPRPSPTSTSATCSSSRSAWRSSRPGSSAGSAAFRPRCCCSPAARWGCWRRAASPAPRATSP